MDMQSSPFTQKALSVTDVYTNLHGLQGLKVEANKDEALKKVAQQFEAMFLNMMMKSMRSANAAFSEGSLFESKETDTYNDMLDQQRALTLAHKNGIGIADAMYRQLSRQNAPVAPSEKPLDELPLRSKKYDNKISESIDTSINTMKANPAAAIVQRIAFADSPQDYVRKVMPYAKEAAAKLGVDPCILVAQSALETGWGKYVLTNEHGESSHNVFNIKATASWQDKKVAHQTLEFNNGVVYREAAEFRAYDSIQSSFEDYALFIGENGRYKNALEKANNNHDYVNELQRAGYATDPEYARKILAVADQVDHYKKKIDSEDTQHKREESARQVGRPI